MGTLRLPPVVMVMLMIVMALLDRYAPLATLLPLVAGLGIAGWHARLFRRRHVNIHTFGEPNALATDGLFVRSRNPMYLGLLQCITGVALLLGSLSPWFGPLTLFALLQHWYIPFEERALTSTFGAEYQHYRQRVRRWL